MAVGICIITFDIQFDSLVMMDVIPETQPDNVTRVLRTSGHSLTFHQSYSQHTLTGFNIYQTTEAILMTFTTRKQLVDVVKERDKNGSSSGRQLSDIFIKDTRYTLTGFNIYHTAGVIAMAF